VKIRHPDPTDGSTLWELVKAAGTLELNSSYTYVLMATHFAETCLIAESGGTSAGLVVAYCPPGRNDAVFVWQVAVAPEFRGRGLGRRLLRALVRRTSPLGVRFLEASVTPSNEASKALFRSLARDVGADCRTLPFMGSELFPEPHEAEDLFRIGPIELDSSRRD